ncbi:ABC transporter ATP-binding protein [Ruminococcus flavefaciens]|uniref:ABC-2 type transport system ATP-binding protein n=1 Tax=Ruminococcus flavefaciens TaxID=1265 RepID=A0A1M7GCB7_RUMFL|nr:ATP-binding cassette domain-containing protein [Ruminococcus flavefaciens]SHM13765.1 ABC-2 type transport system ATP-binding protein [Ruminococcus flavefaciens]
MKDIIAVTNLKKTYKVLQRRDGLIGTFKDLISRNYNSVDVVDNINFNVKRGEIVGFLGPNGAGKSTTIKMLTGVLKPTDGICRVNDFDPFKDRKKYVKEIGVVMGQRTQLWWDLPVIESYKLLKVIYDISDEVYHGNLKIFEELLGLKELYYKPVRNLSLGQRMLCDIAASLLHDPKIIFLDEPTIGLDVSIKYRIRELIKKMNQVRNTTIILTSHDIGDIESLAERIVLINKGKLFFDGKSDEFCKTFSNTKNIEFSIGDTDDSTEKELNEILIRLNRKNGKIPKLATDNGQDYTCAVNTEEYEISELVEALIKRFTIRDINIGAVSLEVILKQVYERESL